SHLFIERNIPEKIVWDGKKMEKDEAEDISGISVINYLDEFDGIISSYLDVSKRLISNYGISKLGNPSNKSLHFINKVKEYFPHLIFAEIRKFVSPLRLIKEESEINELQKAIDVTAAGLEEVFKNIKPGMKEYQAEAILYHEMQKRDTRFWGFTPIVASGKNATTLHYIDNCHEINDNELVLFDVGALSNNYSADISRTFPVAEKFNNRQKEIYSKVLKIQKEIIEMVKPGVALKELIDKTVDLMKIALKELKLIDNDDDYKKYYMHGVGHFLGMDTHDLGDRDAILEAGNVITVEPGIYIKEEKIGIRIEDDILVTEKGSKILSINIPKEIEDLEAIRKLALR
ncbi:MAG: aminopeptidase P N-terminal domain-containing protein, partial [Candidatus Cloacimonadota bacterium]|nr:aminopeptidase P N-terminal domain-containing protein [Candidatus Cloacimonadota bacterium]